MSVALIPVKELSRAKARLAPALNGAERRSLALALFRDVLGAALACPALSGVAVASNDLDVLELAAAAGAQRLAEPGGLNEALTSASGMLAERGTERLIVLAADLPLATPEELVTVAQAGADIVIVPAADGGTNALALAPGSIAFRFGPDSAARHEDEARSAGLRAVRLDLPGLAFDIDTPDDLARLRETAARGDTVGRHTREVLEGLAVSAQFI